MRRKEAILSIGVLILGLFSPVDAAIYRDVAQFTTALGIYDLVDFNDVPTPPMVEISGDRYADSHGLLIEDITGGGIWVRDGDGQRTLGNIHPSGGCRGEFRVSFVLDGQPTTIDGFGCSFGDVDTENMSGIWLYDADDSLLDGGYVEAGGDGVWTFIGATAQDAAYATVIFNDVPGGVVMDNYYFTWIVPEPATLSLLALGGLVLLKRKRKSA